MKKTKARRPTSKKKSTSKRSAKKRPAKKPKQAAKKVTTKVVKADAGFFAAGKRGQRGVERRQFHVLLTNEERAKLVALSNKRKLNAADVVRTLIVEAK